MGRIKTTTKTTTTTTTSPKTTTQRVLQRINPNKFKSSSEYPPKPTGKRIKCGLKMDFGTKKGFMNLYDPKNPDRFKGPDSRMVFANKTVIGEIPVQVGLKKKSDGKTFCGGTLINSWTVLTAAHCVHEGQGGDYLHGGRIVLGFGWKQVIGTKKQIDDIPENKKFGQQIINIDLRKTDDTGKAIKNGGEIKVHPGYPGKYQVNNVYSPNDIALIILPTEVIFPTNSDIGIRKKIK